MRQLTQAEFYDLFAAAGFKEQTRAIARYNRKTTGKLLPVHVRKNAWGNKIGITVYREELPVRLNAVLLALEANGVRYTGDRDGLANVDSPRIVEIRKTFRKKLLELVK